MKPDQKVVKRFGDLLQLGKDLGSGPGMNETFIRWLTASMGLVGSHLGRESPYYTQLADAYGVFRSYGVVESAVMRVRGALNAASEDYSGGHLTRTRTLARAEVSEDVLGQAEELLAAGYKDPACVLAGVALEVAIRDLCEQNGLDIGTLDKMNADLAHREAYNKGMQKQVVAWADRRNAAAHGRWDQYSEGDVGDMIQGVRRFVAEYL